jgi:hypothetical protein
MLYDKVRQRLTASQWFSQGTPVSSTNITEILLKVALSTLIPQIDVLIPGKHIFFIV